MKKKNILIIGAGAWGTALGVLANRQDHKVFLMVRNIDVCNQINTKHLNPRLENYTLDKNIIAVSEYPNNIDIIIFAVPSDYLLIAFDKAIKKYGTNPDMVIATKGMAHREGILLSDYFADKYQISPIFLSGPTFAAEVASGLSSACNIAATTISKADEIASYLECENFKIKTTTDIVSIQIAGCYKNVIAIYFGYISKLGMGENYKARIFTESLTELMEICERMGGAKETIYSYACIGDLVLTSYSSLSRNFRFGAMLGEIEKNNKGMEYYNDETIEGILAGKSLSLLCKSFLHELEILPKIVKLIESYERTRS